MADSQTLLDRLELFGTRLGLDSSRRLLAELGSPEKELKVVLVAGTNGKGSTAGLLASVATAAGYRTGLYTSPHLETVHERLRIDGEAIGEPRLVECLKRTLDSAPGASATPVTYFEALTIAALLYFRQEAVDLAVLEVGLGGRLDATNVTEPVLSIVTEIGLDHQRYLGDSLAEIAGEKAGIFRADRPALAATESAEVRETLERAASDVGATLEILTTEQVHPGGSRRGRETVEVSTREARYDLELPLAGDHQLTNLMLAVRAAEVLRVRGFERIDSEAIGRGVAGCRWPGRLETVSLANGHTVILDGAHNPQAAVALANHLAELEPVTLIFGVVEDKRVEDMLPPLAARARRVLLTRSSSSRARDPFELARYVEGAAVECLPEPSAALDRALESDDPIVICGSLFLVGDLRAELTRRFGRPLPAARMSTSGALRRASSR